MTDAEIREANAGMAYAEGLRLRTLQDGRLDDMRRRSITLLSYVTAAITIVVGLADKHDLSTWSAWAALGSVAGMILSAVVVQTPKDYRDGPNVAQLAGAPYDELDPPYRLRRDIATFYWDHFLHNENGPVKVGFLRGKVTFTLKRGPVRICARAFQLQVVFSGLAVIAILAGFAL